VPTKHCNKSCSACDRPPGRSTIVVVEGTTLVELNAVVTSRSHLAETPVWDEQRRALWWLDYYKPTINLFDPETGENREIVLDQSIHGMALRQSGGIVASLEHGLGFVDLETGKTQIVGDPLRGLDARFNDGKCDRRGRYRIGSMAKDWITPIGSLLRFDIDGTWRIIDTGLVLSNGMGWSPDDRTMYFTDFGRSTIFAYDFYPIEGRVSYRRPFVVIPEGQGRPDGMTVDSKGYLWVALWDGWSVVRFDPTGRQTQIIDLPVQRPTSCTFGGPHLSTL
jgi:sugar lactone lactonase YvrE